MRESAGHRFKFIDLFAGVGGFRIGLQNVGGECVFTSEWDAHSQKTYKAWYGDVPKGNITQLKVTSHKLTRKTFPTMTF